MTRAEAIIEEQARYWRACSYGFVHLAHIRRLAIDRLKYPYLTDKETHHESMGA